jgi:hypothetical protein
MSADITEEDIRIVSQAVEIVRSHMADDLTRDRRKEMGGLHAAFLEFQECVGEGTPLYNHAFTIAFSVVSPDESGENIEAETIRQGIRQRMVDLRDDDELMEAIGAPFDTYRVGE